MYKNILIVGGGKIGFEYSKILTSMRKSHTLLTRSQKQMHQQLKAEIVYDDVLDEKFHLDNDYTHAIICTNIINLVPVTKKLIDMGISKILVEKPISLYSSNIMDLMQFVATCRRPVDVRVAFNRRGYEHNQKIMQVLEEDGGIHNIDLVFGEPIEKIHLSPRPEDEKLRWLIGNTIHLFDYAFWICDNKYEINLKNVIAWRGDYSKKFKTFMQYKGKAFLGNTVIGYDTNWNTQTRWQLKLVTKNHIIDFAPLEEARIKNLKTGCIEELSCSEIDTTYKPGFHKQTLDFIYNNSDDLCQLEQIHNLIMFLEIIGDLRHTNEY